MRRKHRSLKTTLLLTILVSSALLVAGWAAACGDGEEQDTNESGLETDINSISESVIFTTEDGVGLNGHLFGSGGSGVVLAHMYPADQSSWYATAEQFAQQGYLVLTFDFRGYGESQGSKDIEFVDKDVAAAVNEIAEAGADETILIGASMGGTACLVAAARPSLPIPVEGVATLSAPVEFMGLSAVEAMPKLDVPLLFIAAEDDVGAEGATELQRLSSNKGELEIFPGDEHGTNLLTGPYGEEVWGMLSGFVAGATP